MPKRSGSLTENEISIIKSLINKKWRNQDIQATINENREKTINSARITEIKKNNSIKPATDDEVDFFLLKKKSFDPQTGLNIYDDERLIRSREAMILAVKIFNDPLIFFKTEVFTVLANIAWTYLLHEYYERKGIKVIKKGGYALLLSEMLKRHDCPLQKSIKNNLYSIKELRDNVEHQLMGKADIRWLSLFQACCLNFNETLCSLFGEKLNLSHNLSFSIQFSKINFENASLLNKYEIPPHIDALDAKLIEHMTEEEISDIHYQFKVTYTLEDSSKSKADLNFIYPKSKTNQIPHNILVKNRRIDDLYPYKAKAVCVEVEKRTQKRFTLHNHTFAWKKFDVRPLTNKENFQNDFCVFHKLSNIYSYSNEWIDFLIDKINSGETFKKESQ